MSSESNPLKPFAYRFEVKSDAGIFDVIARGNSHEDSEGFFSIFIESVTDIDDNNVVGIDWSIISKRVMGRLEEEDAQNGI